MFLFTQLVTVQIVYKHSNVICDPVDLHTVMSTRADLGQYQNYAWVRESLEKMVFNILTSNQTSIEYWNEALRYYDACNTIIFLSNGRGAPPSRYSDLITDCLAKAHCNLQAEKEHIVNNETANMKYLGPGGNLFLTIVPPTKNEIIKQLMSSTIFGTISQKRDYIIDHVVPHSARLM